jgi:hypothetical protein
VRASNQIPPGALGHAFAHRTKQQNYKRDALAPEGGWHNHSRLFQALALFLTGTTLAISADSNNAGRSELAVSVGSTLHFELAGDEAGQYVPAVPVIDPAPGQSVIRVTFAIDALGNRTLRIRSTYMSSIPFDFRICDGATEPDCRTIVENYVIAAGEELNQLLQDHSHLINFFHFNRQMGASRRFVAASTTAGNSPHKAAN